MISGSRTRELTYYHDDSLSAGRRWGGTDMGYRCKSRDVGAVTVCGASTDIMIGKAQMGRTDIAYPTSTVALARDVGAQRLCGTDIACIVWRRWEGRCPRAAACSTSTSRSLSREGDFAERGRRLCIGDKGTVKDKWMDGWMDSGREGGWKGGKEAGREGERGRKGTRAEAQGKGEVRTLGRVSTLVGCEETCDRGSAACRGERRRT
eukprot:2111855-Rhodomonas_salina.2